MATGSAWIKGRGRKLTRAKTYPESQIVAQKPGQSGPNSSLSVQMTKLRGKLARTGLTKKEMQTVLAFAKNFGTHLIQVESKKPEGTATSEQTFKSISEKFVTIEKLQKLFPFLVKRIELDNKRRAMRAKLRKAGISKENRDRVTLFCREHSYKTFKMPSNAEIERRFSFVKGNL